MAPTDGALEALNNTYERALVTMHKMPRVWLDYLSLLVDQRLVTRARRGFDRALCALPVTQHDRVWQLYLVSEMRDLLCALAASIALGSLGVGLPLAELELALGGHSLYLQAAV